MEEGNLKVDWNQNINARLKRLELILVLWRIPHSSWPGSLGITTHSNLVICQGQGFFENFHCQQHYQASSPV